jgi:protoporphyrinogen oxidase
MSDHGSRKHSVVVIGAGPAGLTAAHELSKRDVPAIVLEAADDTVGGLSRTVNYKGYLSDIGGFFSKWDEVNQIWSEILGDKFLERPRLSRISYKWQTICSI